MGFLGLKPPAKKIMKQKAMLTVVYGLLPCLAASIYFFGWRSALLLAVILVFGLATEAVFTYREGKPVTQAALVTCLIFHLSLPPTIPFYMAALGIVFGVASGQDGIRRIRPQPVQPCHGGPLLFVYQLPLCPHRPVGGPALGRRGRACCPGRPGWTPLAGPPP
jgi:Na+-transporting NADH:ubiquinone oxidoreductase subunit NqrB